MTELLIISSRGFAYWRLAEDSTHTHKYRRGICTTDKNGCEEGLWRAAHLPGRSWLTSVGNRTREHSQYLRLGCPPCIASDPDTARAHEIRYAQFVMKERANCTHSFSNHVHPDHTVLLASLAIRIAVCTKKKHQASQYFSDNYHVTFDQTCSKVLQNDQWSDACLPMLITVAHKAWQGPEFQLPLLNINIIRCCKPSMMTYLTRDFQDDTFWKLWQRHKSAPTAANLY